LKPLLLLVDLQQDFLTPAGLEPHRATVVAGAHALLQGCRERGVPVCHVWTTVQADPDERMPHWKKAGRWSCVAGSPGHQVAPGLEPLPGETVLHKSVFSAFANGVLNAQIKALGVDTIIIAGVHTHTCVRQAALDAYQLGLATWIAAEAIASYEPLEAAQTDLYLQHRGIKFVPTHQLFDRLDVHISPADDDVTTSAQQVDNAVRTARSALVDFFSTSLESRLTVLENAARLLEQRATDFAAQLTAEVRKPIRQARGEVERAIQLFRAVARRVAGQTLQEQTPEARVIRRPHGVVALITPWNNPLAIPAGQLAPALAYGNSVIWKPAAAGLAVARNLQQILLRAGLPTPWLQIVPGGDDAGLEVIAHRGVDAVTFTGSSANGWKVLHVCGGQHKPLQAELGGNNGAIVGADCADLETVARQIAEAAFGFAGQRCTATRRAIVLDAAYDSFLAQLEKCTAALVWGMPENEATQVGPLLSPARAERVASIVTRARAEGFTVLQPHLESQPPPTKAHHPPTLILCDRPDAEIVQEETFGPVLVVQRARDWDHAIELLNGVRHGLAAACFTRDPHPQQRFLAEARAGILKINRATADAGVDVPFGGWKNSGSGAPQHGIANIEFYTRLQTIYAAE
jgi:acyl-CoA reductase-like NAD-dependent aldehyde dehydrogenase/nicotinamidase-related amidase